MKVRYIKFHLSLSTVRSFMEYIEHLKKKSDLCSIKNRRKICFDNGCGI